MFNFTMPTDSTSSIMFLMELHEKGLLYHPEENAFDSLQQHDLPVRILEEIDMKMRAIFQYLVDPCAVALDVTKAVEVA